MPVNSNEGRSPSFKTPAQESLEAHLKPSSRARSSTTPSGSPVMTTSTTNMSGEGSTDNTNGSGSPTPTSSSSDMSREGSPTPTASTADRSGATLESAFELLPQNQNPHTPDGHNQSQQSQQSQHETDTDNILDSEQFWTRSITRVPIDIPGGVRHETPLPQSWEPSIRFEKGGLGTLDKHLIEPHKNMDAVLTAMDAHYEGLKQGIRDWVAKEKAQGTWDNCARSTFITDHDRKKKEEKEKEALNESDSTEDPLVPDEDVRVGNATMVGKDKEPEYKKFLSQAHGHEYPHTAAGLAYEEGRKSCAYKEGYMAGLIKIRYEREYNLGYQQALRQYGHPPEPYRPPPKAEPSTRAQRATRSPIVQQDGSILSHQDLVDEVRKLMDHLNIPRADFDEQLEYYNDTGKKKEEKRPRTSLEVSEFAKDMAFALEMDE